MPFAEGPTSRRYILVAEADNAMRDVLAVTLRSQDYQVVTVDDGRTLLATLVRDQAAHRLPRLVVSDIFLPQTSGLSVLSTARRQGIFVDFVFLAAVGDDDVIAEARALGAMAVYEKPFDLKELSDLISSVEPGASTR
jgi:two-component system response regulator (stage 0 sporulation protein F)